MILKNSIFFVKDSCNVDVVKTIHIYKKFTKNVGNSGFITKSTLFKFNKKKKKWKGRLPKTISLLNKIRFLKKDGCQLYFFENSCAILKKRVSIRGKLVKGPFIFNIKKKKLLKSFVKVI